MKKKIIFILIIILAIVLVAGYFYFQNWRQMKQEKIRLGLASDKFPWRDWTEEELAKMYPQIKYADVPTRTTPEETYAKFRQALKDSNLDLAIEQFNKESGKYQENLDILDNFNKENKFGELYQHYSEKITNVSIYESLAQYEYTYYSSQYKQELVGSLNFLKDANGDWKLDSF
jgi:hypothetical protein